MKERKMKKFQGIYYNVIEVRERRGEAPRGKYLRIMLLGSQKKVFLSLRI